MEDTLELTLTLTLDPSMPPRSHLQKQGGKGLLQQQRQQQQQQQEDEHCCWAAVQALLPHWSSLDDERKTLFAQMAVVTL